MISLQTYYLGLNLKNPIIVSSSGLTSNLNSIKTLEQNNAAAIVLKSLFEEQIKAETNSIIEKSDTSYPEAIDYIRDYSKQNLISDYLKLIETTKKSVSIPVIASINCISNGGWIDFAKKIENAGADAIELNINILPIEINLLSAHYEEIYIDILKKIKSQITIPVSLKISNYFTNILNITNKLILNGANGIVLFNRFYQPDININDLSFTSSEIFSNSNDYSQTLRWIGILSGKISNIDLAASTGVQSGETAIKMILAGAKAVQVCSTIYKNGIRQIQIMLNDIEKWMSKNHYNTIEEFRGKMNYKNISNAQEYERMQFIKYFSLNNKHNESIL